jgi:hypothetical protein
MVTAYHNVAVGDYSGGCLSSGCNNTFLGGYSGNYSGIGSSSLALGYAAGKYMTSSCEFYINTLDRTSCACDKVCSLVYGCFNSTGASQIFNINAITCALVSLTSPIVCGTTCVVSPVTLGSTCVCGAIVCSNSCMLATTCVVAGSYYTGINAGIDATVTYVDALLGAKTLTFCKGILTAQA